MGKQKDTLRDQLRGAQSGLQFERDQLVAKIGELQAKLDAIEGELAELETILVTHELVPS